MSTCLAIAALAAPVGASGLPSSALHALESRRGAALVMSLPERKIAARYGTSAALDEAHVTGSAIKPLTALVALEKGSMRADTAILCQRETRAAGRILRCSHPAVLLPMTVPEALAVSCNYFFAEAGRRTGAAALERAFTAAGFEARVTDAALAATGHAGVRATPQAMLNFITALEAGRLPYRAEFMAIVRRGLEAAAAGIAAAGKTGTASREGAPHLNSGWFAGWAPAASPKLAVAIWIARGEGKDAAAIAAEIFAASSPTVTAELFSSVALPRVIVHPPGAPATHFGGAQTEGKTDRILCGQPGCRINADGQSPRQVIGTLEIREQRGRVQVLHITDLESYVAGVLAGEAGTLRNEALKAMAVAARTFAEAKRGRHGTDGFDFCSLTHCQVYSDQAPSEMFRIAAQATAGKVLQYGGKTAHAYYSASCGGHTQAAGNVWPEEAALYLPARRDAFCLREPRAWTSRIPAMQLLMVLRGDAATDPGTRLENIAVSARDSSGRAQQLALSGSRSRLVNGNYFRFLVGRRLGWDRLKSTLFEVRREGRDFLFNGRGFGHGIGLCQDGAAQMAAAGHGYARILANYFPGTKLSGASKEAEAILEKVRQKYAVRGIAPPPHAIEVIVHDSAAGFSAATGKPVWAAASSDGGRLHLQPLATLRARGVLETTIAHEYLHLALWGVTDPRIPIWFREGLALYFSGEEPQPEVQPLGRPLAIAIERPRSRVEMRDAYARALRETRALARDVGAGGLLRILRSPTEAELARLQRAGTLVR